VTLPLADSKNKDRSLAAYVISFLAAPLPATLAVGHIGPNWGKPLLPAHWDKPHPPGI